jgi:hypothetical protein
MVSWTPQQLREWHVQCMDLLVQNPAITYEELGEILGVHKQSVMLVVNSDLFQVKLRERRERRSAVVDKSVLERLDSLAKVSIDQLEERIKKQRQLLGLDEVRETAEMALRGLGFISNAPRQENHAHISVVVAREDLAAARALMKREHIGEATAGLSAAPATGELIDAEQTGT